MGRVIIKSDKMERVDIRNRIIHEACNQCVPTVVDRDSIIRNVILFDKFIIKSFGLEIPALVSLFGYEGLISLIKNDAIGFYFDFILQGMYNENVLPNNFYNHICIKPHNEKEPIHKAFESIEIIENISYKQKKNLKKVISDYLTTSSTEEIRFYGVDFENSVSNESYVKSSIANFCYNKYHINIVKEKVDTNIKKANYNGFDGYFITTNLNELVGRNVEREIMRGVLFGIYGVSKKLYEMKKYHAINAFNDNEIGFFEDKIKFLLLNHDAEKTKSVFNKVIEYAGFPDFTNAVINVDRLMEIKGSEECKLFKQWLWSVESLSDKEIKEYSTDIFSKICNKLNCQTGKTIRWVITTGLGFVEPVSATILSGLDTFVLEKIFPQKGISAFINEKIPSIFNPEKHKQES